VITGQAQDGFNTKEPAMMKDEYEYLCLMVLDDEDTVKADPDLACGCAMYLTRQGYDQVDDRTVCGTTD
jgi:hypothetical protein